MTSRRFRRSVHPTVYAELLVSISYHPLPRRGPAQLLRLYLRRSSGGEVVDQVCVAVPPEVRTRRSGTPSPLRLAASMVDSA